jgi:hypothetical protein
MLQAAKDNFIYLLKFKNYEVEIDNKGLIMLDSMEGELKYNATNIKIKLI